MPLQGTGTSFDVLIRCLESVSWASLLVQICVPVRGMLSFTGFWGLWDLTPDP